VQWQVRGCGSGGGGGGAGGGVSQRSGVLFFSSDVQDSV
jgi:hypothetical protein